MMEGQAGYLPDVATLDGAGPVHGDVAGRGRAVALPAAAMDRLMPMHLHLSPAGRILAHGPTLGRIAGAGQRPLIGQEFFALFSVRRPTGVFTMADLAARQGMRLHLQLQDGGTEFRGLAMADAGTGILLNLSFGIGVVEAVRQHALTDADFAPTDLTVEMLYLVEVKRSVLAALQRLNCQLEGAKSLAEEQALTDTLTGLRNRRALDIALANACAGPQDFALMHLDLDRFKAVNDSLGHAAGDHVLQAVATVLRQETREGDTVARVGGDEFVILLPRLTDAVRLAQVARRIISGVTRPVFFDGEECRIGASVGVTCSSIYDQRDPQRMLQDADQALYAAKRAGRGRVSVFGVDGDDPGPAGDMGPPQGGVAPDGSGPISGGDA